MNKIWLILKREFLTRVKKRAFIVTTLVVPLLFVAAIIIMGMIMANSQENLTIAVKDDTALFENKIRGLDKQDLKFKYYDSDDLSKEDLEETYSKMGYDGLIYIPEIDFERPQAQSLNYYSNQKLGLQTKEYIEGELSEVMREQMIQLEGYDKDKIKDINSASLQLQPHIDGKAESEGQEQLATVIGYLCAFLIYIYLFAYGAMVMRGVMEEKNNRIVEVIITTIKPFQLMMGKILGIGAVGLFQLFIWGILQYGILTIAILLFGDSFQASPDMSSGMNQVSPEDMQDQIMAALTSLKELNWFRLIFSFIFYFLFGYIFYASQFAAVGAAASDDGDVQSLMFPITVPIIISIVIMSITIQQPFSNIAVWSSLIPFTSPIIMMSRIPFFEAEWGHQILSMLILFVCSIGMVWVAGRIYRIGILIQGQKPSFLKLWKWIRYS